MKNLLIILSLTFVSLNGYSQTTVFEKNSETARYNRSRNISKTVTSVFVSNNLINPDQYAELVEIMGIKDGYVSCKLNSNNELIVTHEDWMVIDDVVRVISVASITVTFRETKPYKNENE